MAKQTVCDNCGTIQSTFEDWYVVEVRKKDFRGGEVYDFCSYTCASQKLAERSRRILEHQS